MTSQDKEELLRSTLREYAEQTMAGRDLWPALRRAASTDAQRPSRRRRSASATPALIASSLILAVLLGSLGVFALWGRGGSSLAPQNTVTMLSVPPMGPPPPEGVDVGNSLPDVLLNGVDGQPVRLGSGQRGQPVWISFWTTWCPPCRAEMPELARLQSKYTGQGLVMISVDPQEESATVRQFMRDNAIRWAVALDPTASVVARYQVTGIPLHLLIGRDGVVRQRLVGRQADSRLEEGLRDLLRER